MHLQLPLFPSYVFVRFALSDKLRILETPSVAFVVGNNGGPSALAEEEIDALRAGLASSLRAQPHPYLGRGRRMRIVRGPLEGYEGIVLRGKSNFRLVLSVDVIRRSIVVDVDQADIAPLPNSHSRTGSTSGNP